MSFRKSQNESDQWQTFCQRHDGYLSQIPRIACLFNSSGRFDEFLQSGLYAGANDTISIQSITAEEWPAFLGFVDHYSNDWQSYFTRTMYAAYFAESERRRWLPSTIPFNSNDLACSHLVIHFWASWNMVDRPMDSNLESAASSFDGIVDFRSLNIDLPRHRDFCLASNVANIPALGFYVAGIHDSTLIGLREPNTIVEIVSNWLDTGIAR